MVGFFFLKHISPLLLTFLQMIIWIFFFYFCYFFFVCVFISLKHMWYVFIYFFFFCSLLHMQVITYIFPFSYATSIPHRRCSILILTFPLHLHLNTLHFHVSKLFFILSDLCIFCFFFRKKNNIKNSCCSCPSHFCIFLFRSWKYFLLLFCFLRSLLRMSSLKVTWLRLSWDAAEEAHVSV